MSQVSDSAKKTGTSPAKPNPTAPKYPGVRVTCNGNFLVAEHVETRITEGGVFYPITPSTEGGEIYQGSYAAGELDVWGHQKIAVETEGEHAAQGGATAYAVSGKRTVNFTSGQGIAYAMEQYYHAPGKFSTMVLEVGARALTKHALNVHCGHDDFYAALDTGWTMIIAKDAQQAADQAIILRKVNELSLNPGMNIQDGMLTTHSERTYLAPEADLLREFLGAADDKIECPTPAQRELFGPHRRRVPEMMDLKNPLLLGPVQNQEHHMNGVVARRNNFNEPILKFLEDAYAEFGRLTGRHYGLIHQYQVRRRRHGVRFARLRRGQHRGGLRLPARETQREGRLHSHQRHSPVSRSRRHQRPARQEERHHPRTHRRRHGGRQSARARHPRGPRQGQ